MQRMTGSLQDIHVHMHVLIIMAIVTPYSTEGRFVTTHTCRLQLFYYQSRSQSLIERFGHPTYRHTVVMRLPHQYDVSHRTERNRLGLPQNRLNRPKQDLAPSHIRSSQSSPLTHLGAHAEMDVHCGRGSEWLA